MNGYPLGDKEGLDPVRSREAFPGDEDQPAKDEAVDLTEGEEVQLRDRVKPFISAHEFNLFLD